MAKKIRFPLKMKNGAEVRSLEELKENFDLESVLGYFTDGKLVTWLADRYYDEKAAAVSALSADMPDFNAKLCEILEVEYQVDDDVTDLEYIQRRNEKLRILNSVTADQDILNNIDNVAMDQNELYGILDESPVKVYLYGEKFEIPFGKKNICYIGINSPLVILEKDKNVANYKANCICFDNLQFEDGINVNGEELFLSGKYKEAFPIIESEANNRNTRAMYIMGLYYEGGYNTVKINEIERNKWYEIGASYNDPLCLYGYSDYVLTGKIHKNKRSEIRSKIAEEIKNMALSGDIFAQHVYGTSFAPFQYCFKAAEKEFPKSLYRLSFEYYTGFFLSKDKFKAFEYGTKAANHGLADAQERLGYYYREGIGVERNEDKAIEWYKKAAIQDHSEAFDNLISIIKEKNTTINRNKAVRPVATRAQEGRNLTQEKISRNKWYIELLKELAGHGSVIALNKLGKEYHDYSDDVEAIEWYKKALEKGSIEAMYELGCIYKPTGYFSFACDLAEDIDGSERIKQDWDEAFKYFSMAANKGDIKSYFKLGELYEIDFNDKKDIEKAKYWFRLAAEHDHAEARKKLWQYT